MSEVINIQEEEFEYVLETENPNDFQGRQKFNPAVAIYLGSIAEAVVVYFFQNCINEHIMEDRNFHDGRTWNYCTIETLQSKLCFLTYKQIKTVLKKLVDKEILIEGNYNKLPIDRTTWYAFKDEKFWRIGGLKKSSRRAQMGRCKSPNGPTITTPIQTPIYKENSQSVNRQTVKESPPSDLTDSELISFDWMKTRNFGSTDQQLRDIAKEYSLPRIKKAYESAVSRGNVRNIGAYVLKILEEEKKAEEIKEKKKWLEEKLNENKKRFDLGDKEATVWFKDSPITIQYWWDKERICNYLNQKGEEIYGKQL